MSRRKKISIVFHYRRYHICGTLNELENGFVNQCEKCKKYFAPFYFFEESEIPIVSDDPNSSEQKNTVTGSSGYRPLTGISFYWEE